MLRKAASKVKELVFSLLSSSTQPPDTPTASAEEAPTLSATENTNVDGSLLDQIDTIEGPDEAYRLCEQCLNAGLLNIPTIAPLCPYVIELARLTQSGQADGPRMWHCLALVAESRQKHDVARKLLERAILFDTSDVSLRNSMAVVLLNQGKPSMACCIASQASLIQPQSAAIRASLEASRQALRAHLHSIHLDFEPNS